jgi:hypothetical protein
LLELGGLAQGTIRVVLTEPLHGTACTRITGISLSTMGLRIGSVGWLNSGFPSSLSFGKVVARLESGYYEYTCGTREMSGPLEEHSALLAVPFSDREAEDKAVIQNACRNSPYRVQPAPRGVIAHCIPQGRYPPVAHRRIRATGWPGRGASLTGAKPNPAERTQIVEPTLHHRIPHCSWGEGQSPYCNLGNALL